MSAEVVWQCIKNGNAFLRKGSNNRGDPIFSSEPGNLLARHSFKHSGAPPGTLTSELRCVSFCVRAQREEQVLGFSASRDLQPLTTRLRRPGQRQDAAHRGGCGRQAARDADEDECEERRQACQARRRLGHQRRLPPQGDQGGRRGGVQVPA